MARSGQVRFTRKARSERDLLDLDLNESDALRLLAELRPSDFDQRIRSDATGEWLYVFRPTIGEARLYVKVVLRTGCSVISFHEEAGDDDEP